MRVLVGVGGLLAIGAGGLYLVTPSLLMKLLPPPKAERIVLSGRAASGTVIDGGGGWYNGGKFTELVIRSERTAGGWARPENIAIRNLRLRGSIRIMGLGRNGEAAGVRESSVRTGHTERAQTAAPTRIVISNVVFEACRRIPLYLAPGVTEVTVEHCAFGGWSGSVAVYLDAESGRNAIRGNTFVLRTGREVIAVDGSANNRIESNRFDRLALGGIYLYRNCGEGGTVRHQTPHGNTIAGNRFREAPFWRSHGIWLGSRNGRRPHRDADAGYPFGSSADNRDFADDNTVTGNVFEAPTRRDIRDAGQNNRITP